MSELERKLVTLISRDLGVSPEDITPEFIHKWREENLYPNAQYEFSGRYGGYNSGARQVLSISQIRNHREIAESFLKQFCRRGQF